MMETIVHIERAFIGIGYLAVFHILPPPSPSLHLTAVVTELNTLSTLHLPSTVLPYPTLHSISNFTPSPSCFIDIFIFVSFSQSIRFGGRLGG